MIFIVSEKEHVDRMLHDYEKNQLLYLFTIIQLFTIIILLTESSQNKLELEDSKQEEAT